MDIDGRHGLHLLASGQPLNRCTADFRHQVARLRFVPISETRIESKHQKATVARKKATNAGAVEMSLSNRLEVLKPHLQNIQALETLTQAFSRARKLQDAPKWLGFPNHPLLTALTDKCRRRGERLSASKVLKPLTSIIYNTDTESQFASVSLMKQQHQRATAAIARSAASAAKVQPQKHLGWEAALFWEHILSQGQQGVLILLLAKDDSEHQHASSV